MLNAVKMALRVTTNAFDDEIGDLINAALCDMGRAGITNKNTDDPLVRRAVITYCRMNFGQPDQNIPYWLAKTNSHTPLFGVNFCAPPSLIC